MVDPEVAELILNEVHFKRLADFHLIRQILQQESPQVRTNMSYNLIQTSPPVAEGLLPPNGVGHALLVQLTVVINVPPIASAPEPDLVYWWTLMTRFDVAFLLARDQPAWAQSDLDKFYHTRGIRQVWSQVVVILQNLWAATELKDMPLPVTLD